MLGPNYGEWWKVTPAQRRRRLVLASLPFAAVLLWALAGYFSEDKLGKAAFVAVEHGKLSEFQELLARGAAIDARNTRGATLLHWSLEHRRPRFARAALQAGVDVDAVDRRGVTALHLAADQGEAEVVRLMLDRQADPNVYHQRYATPLHRAAAAGHDEVVEHLLAAGAGVEARDRGGLTPLYFAVRFGRVGVAKTLLAHGAAVEISDANGRRPLHWAAGSPGGELIAPLITANAEVDALDSRGNSALHIAVRRGRHENARRLLAGGAEVDVRTPGLQVRPLHLAVQRGDVRMVRELIGAGADVNAYSGLYGTPLHWVATGAAIRPDVRLTLAAVLVNAGARPDTPDDHGYTAARRARDEGHRALAHLLKPHRAAQRRPGRAAPEKVLARANCTTPSRMHQASRMILDNYLNGEVGTAEYRRRFSLPNSDYVVLAECLSGQ